MVKNEKKFIQSLSIVIVAVSVIVVAGAAYGLVTIVGSFKKTQVAVQQDSQQQNQPGQVGQPQTPGQVLNDDNPAPKPSTKPPVDVAKVKTAGNPFIGDANAKVVIAYWFDYQCPFCNKMEQTVITALITDYIETGKAKLVYKDYQFLGANSQTAGLVARAVWETAPEKFLEWHQAMFENQDGENSGWGNKADILAMTKSLGIDSAKVDRLMTDKATEYQKAIAADKAEGKILGIKGTPATIIGKKLLSGPQSYSVFKAAVEQALSEQ